MAEPIPAAGGAPRRWWDLTPKERNIVAFTLLFLITLPMLTKIFTSDFGTHIAHRARRSCKPRPSPTRSSSTTRPSDGTIRTASGDSRRSFTWCFPSVGPTASRSSFWAVVFGIFLLLHRASRPAGGAPSPRGPRHLRVFRVPPDPHPAAAGDLHVLLHRADDLPVQRIFLRDAEETDLPVSARRAGLGELPPHLPDGVPPVRSVRRGSPGPRDLAERVPVGAP